MHKNKAIIVFLAKFFTTYFVLFGAYSLYLSKTQQKGEVFSCSPITSTVAGHVNQVSRMLGYDTRIEQNTDELSIRFIINGDYASRIILLKNGTIAEQGTHDELMAQQGAYYKLQSMQAGKPA